VFETTRGIDSRRMCCCLVFEAVLLVIVINEEVAMILVIVSTLVISNFIASVVTSLYIFVVNFAIVVTVRVEV